MKNNFYELLNDDKDLVDEFINNKKYKFKEIRKLIVDYNKRAMNNYKGH